MKVETEEDLRKEIDELKRQLSEGETLRRLRKERDDLKRKLKNGTENWPDYPVWIWPNIPSYYPSRSIWKI